MWTDEQVQSNLLRLIEERDGEGVAKFGKRLLRSRRATTRSKLAIAQALADCGDTFRSVAWYDCIEKGDKAYNFSRSQIARLLNGSGKYRRVLKLTGAFSDDQITSPLAIARVRAFVGMGCGEEALAFVERYEASQIAPAELLAAAAEAALAPRGWAGVLAFLERALELSTDPRLVFRRGLALFQLDRLDECLTIFQELKTDRDFHLKAQQYIVRILQRQREFDKLLVACHDLLSSDPANELGHEVLVRYNVEQNDLTGIMTSYKNAHSFYPEKFPMSFLDFVILERKGLLIDALLPFKSGGEAEQLTETMKEKIATTFYFAGQYDHAKKLADFFDDGFRRKLIYAKTDLAIGLVPDLTELPENRESQLAMAVNLYNAGDFAECIEILDVVDSEADGALGVKNFSNLARAGRVLTDKLYATAVDVPRSPGALPIIQLLWVGSALSKIELLSIRSFLACGHEVHLYSYDRDISVPPGCVVKDAGEIIPESEIFMHSGKAGRSKGSLAGFADMFRWKLIYERGGAWADCDVICLKPIDSTCIVSTELARLGTFVVPGVTNCFFASPPGEPAFLRAFEEARSADRSALLWGEIGIHKMSDIVAEEHWQDRLTSPSDICPIPSFRIVDAIHGKFDVDAVIEMTGCRAVHLYNEVMRMVNLDKHGAFPFGSLLELLDKRVSTLEGSRR